MVFLSQLPRDTSSQARVSAHGFRDPGKLAWAEHFSRGSGMTLSVNHSSCLVFTSAVDRMLIFIRFWKADLHSWNCKGCWEAVNQSCCLFCEQWMGGNWLYPTKQSSVLINDATKVCLAQTHLPGSLETVCWDSGLWGCPDTDGTHPVALIWQWLCIW